MAQYAGIAGTRKATDAIGDEMMEMLNKHFKTVAEESGQEVTLDVEGGFELEGEAALDKNNSLGVAVRASAPELVTTIPVDLDTEVGVDRRSSGTVRAGISYYFRARLTANNISLSNIRRETLTNEDGTDADINSLGR